MLGGKLKALRKKKGITQSELADVLGVSTSMVGMYETDSRNPSYEILIKIGSYFKVSIDYLIGAEEIHNVGILIRKEREKHGIGQKELANKIGVSLKELLNYEKDMEPININILAKITDTLDIPSEDFNKKYETIFNTKFYDSDFIINEKAIKNLTKYTQNKSIEPLPRNNQSNIIAAHLDGVDLTKEEMEDLKKYIDFLLSKRRSD